MIRRRKAAPRAAVLIQMVGLASLLSVPAVRALTCSGDSAALHLDLRIRTLTVNSAHGTPTPVGTSHHIAGAGVSCGVDADVGDTQTREHCTGWTGTGSVPTTGTANSTTVTLAQDSTLTWTWQAQHWLDVATDGAGSVDVGDGWFAVASTVTLAATPHEGGRFDRWEGDIPPDADPHAAELTVTMDTARSVQAVFITAHAPVLTEGDSVSAAMDEDGYPEAFSLTLHATDADGDAIAWSIAEPAGNGTAGVTGNGTSATVQYAPKLNWHGGDSFAVAVTDGVDGTDTVTVNVTVRSVNDAPVVDLDADTQGTGFDTVFLEGDGPVEVTGGDTMLLADVDDHLLASASVALVERPDGVNEMLSADTANTGVTASYDRASGELALVGPASVAEFASALGHVLYENVSEAPDTTDRTIEFTVSDGKSASVTAVTTLTVVRAVRLHLAVGWNLLSLPFEVTDGVTPDQILCSEDGAVLYAGNLWGWNSLAKRYVDLTTGFPAKAGFWAYCASAGAVTTRPVHGELPQSATDLYAGWNLIGPVVTCSLVDIPGIENAAWPLWWWDSSLQAYRRVGETDSIERGKGYWIYVPDDCQIDLPLNTP